MRFLPLFVLSSIIEASTNVTSQRGKTLEEVYGKVDSVKEMTPFYARPSKTKESRYNDEYLSHRTQEICDFPLEILILQDATSSFEDDIQNMRETQLSLMVESLKESHPGSAFGTISFKDKPLWPLGGPDDYCVRFGSPLVTDASAVMQDYAKLAVYGGGDPPEAQFVALVAGAQSSTPKWGVIPTATRLIVVASDAAPHFDEDGFNTFGLPPFSGTFDEANNDQQCIQEYYPGPSTVRDAITNRNTYLASLIYDGSYNYQLPIEAWKWFNSYLGQTDGFVHDMESDSSNFWERLSQIIQELENVECGPSTEQPTPGPTAAPTAVATPAASTSVPVTPVGTPQVTLTPAVSATVPVTPIGTPQATSETEECPPCPECPTCPPCPPEGCDPCCREGVLIKLAYRPKRLHLEVEN